MGRIRTLPAHVVNQIAAGEVVERPSSVVKELIENALDAGATRVDVSLRDGGRSRIEVADDGCGMDAEDLASAFLPHATSKLREVDDLEHIGSLGFRGEALASIGSVSRASVVSRPEGAATGAIVEDRDGEIAPVRPCGAAPGTVVVVENLFGAVPARRKFLRTAGTETGHVVETVERFALAFPDVAFRLEQDGRVLVRAEAGEGRLARIGRFYGSGREGDDLAKALLRIEVGGEPALEAFLGPPSVSRADARCLQVFVNGRAVRDKTVFHAIREAFRDLVPPGHRQPVAFVFLTCDPARVDVNVHPAKAEVRWRDPSVVHEVVRRALRATLEGARPGVPLAVGPATRGDVPASTVAAAEFAFTRGRGLRPGGEGWVGEGPSPRPNGIAGEGPFGDAPPCDHAHGDDHGPGAPPAAPTSVPDSARVSAPNLDETLRPLGQAHGTYLLLESDDGLVIVDQHALHERVLFDEISHRLEAAGNLEVQHLLVPLVVDVGAADAARLDEERDLLGRLGWVVEPFGEGAVAVRGCPAVLRRPDPGAVFREVLALLDEGRREGLDRAALVSSVVDRLACRAAVMAGDALHPDEVRALLERAERLNHAHSCPHGRPTRLVMSRRDLERFFHRTG